MKSSLVLSRYQTEDLLQARQEGVPQVQVSPDLGLSSLEVFLEESGVRFSDDLLLTWEVIEEIGAAENSCFLIEEGEPHPIRAYSEYTNRVYGLMPTARAPTMLVSGIPMHRIKGTDPYRDTLEKIRTIKPVVGRVLDTATGLGYTAIEAAKSAEHVTTIELDPAVLEIARLNPWSRALFDHPRIDQHVGDSYDLVQEFADASFSRIIHDPPAFSLAGHLYGGGFYAELHRLLRPGGRLFHYVGNPESKSGRNITRGVIRRLDQAGFSRIRPRPRAFGLVAFK